MKKVLVMVVALGLVLGLSGCGLVGWWAKNRPNKPIFENPTPTNSLPSEPSNPSNPSEPNPDPEPEKPDSGFKVLPPYPEVHPKQYDTNGAVRTEWRGTRVFNGLEVNTNSVEIMSLTNEVDIAAAKGKKVVLEGSRNGLVCNVYAWAYQSDGSLWQETLKLYQYPEEGNRIRYYGSKTWPTFVIVREDGVDASGKVFDRWYWVPDTSKKYR